MKRRLWLIGTYALAAAAAEIGEVGASPDRIAAGEPSQVTVTALVRGLDVIPGSVVLQRLDNAGKVVGTAGSMHDDGNSGDAAAGDGVYTVRASFLENAAGEIRLRVSAAARGQAQRMVSAVATVRVAPPRQ